MSSSVKSWRRFFTADKPVVGATEEELRRIKVPTIIIAGGDEVHPTVGAQKLREMLPQSEYHPPLWTAQERELLAQTPERSSAATAERVGPILLDFLARHQPRAGVRA